MLPLQQVEASVSIAIQHALQHMAPAPGPVTEPRLGRSVSIDQAAQLLSVSRRTVYYRIREGRLRTVRTLGGSQRVLIESLYGLGFRPQAFSTSASAATFTLRPVRT
jgi:excisionase family DNA binding protein